MSPYIVYPVHRVEKESMMSRQLELQKEVRTAKRRERTWQAAEYALEGTIGTLGGRLTGAAFSISEVDCLLTLKAVFEGKHMVAFLGADSIAGCLLAAVSQGQNNNLRWKADKYRPDEV